MSDDFNLVEYFRKNVTLPNDTVTIYTDGATAWKYAALKEQIDTLESEQETLLATIGQIAQRGDKIVRGLADEAPGQKYQDRLEAIEQEIDALREEITSVLGELAKSGVTFTMRAMFPKELYQSDEQAKREVNKEAKEAKLTLSEEERQEKIAARAYWVYLEKSVTAVTYPDGSEAKGPFKSADFQAVQDMVDATEFARLRGKLNELNTKAAIRDAQGDAGFPGGRTEQAGEQ